MQVQWSKINNSEASYAKWILVTRHKHSFRAVTMKQDLTMYKHAQWSEWQQHIPDNS